MRNRSVVFAVILALAAVPGTAAAQAMTIHPASDNVISLEAGHPFLSDDILDAFSFAGYAGFRYSLSKVVLVGDIPFAYIGGDNGSTALGNIYLGGEMPLSRLIQLGAGVRLPTMSGDGAARFVPAFVDFDRSDAFYSEAVSVRAILESRRPAEGTAVDWHAGLVHSRSTNEASESLSIGLYGLGLSRHGGRIVGGAGVIGNILLSDAGDADFGERTIHTIDTWLDYGSGRVRPGISVRIPLDEDMRDNMSAVASLRMQVLVR